MLGQTITGALANIPFPFGIDSQGNYGYRKEGADTVTPFSSGSGDPLKDVSGSIQWYASYRGNTATIPINCEGWPVIKFYVSYSQYATSISSYLEKLDGTTTSSVTRTYNTWYTIDNSNREYKKLNVVVAGTVSQYTGYGTVQYQLEQGSNVDILSSSWAFASVSRATSLQLTGVKINTPIIAIFNTGRAHTPVTSSITFGTDQVQHMRTNEVIGAFGNIIYGKNLIVTADTLSSTINISATYDSSDSGNVSSLSALYVAET